MPKKSKDKAKQPKSSRTKDKPKKRNQQGRY